MRALAFIAAASLTGCIAYNDQCEGLVEDPSHVDAFVEANTPIYLDKNNARTDNNALGQVAADAFVDAFADSGDPAVFGIENGGAIRAEGLCTTHNLLPKGSKITRGLLHEIFLFQNLVVVLDLTEAEVIQMFEHSVDRLFPATSTINLPAGQFLQVSKAVSMTVDCSKPIGSRVTQLSVNGEPLTHPGSTTRMFRVAMTNFQTGGNDGYRMLIAPAQDPTRNPAQAQRLGGIDNNIIDAYLDKQTGLKDPATGLKAEPRIQFALAPDPNDPMMKLKPTCATPPPPTGP